MSGSKDLFLPRLDFHNIALPEIQSFGSVSKMLVSESKCIGISPDSMEIQPDCHVIDTTIDNLDKIDQNENNDNNILVEEKNQILNVFKSACNNKNDSGQSSMETNRKNFNYIPNLHLNRNNNTDTQEIIAHQVVIQMTGLDNIAGLDDVKQSLREAIVYPTKYPQLFTNRTVWSRALLYGAPGVGKTAIAHAIAAEANIPLYQVTSADLTSPWVGKSEKLIRQIFTTLGQTRCILFLDEVDSLCKTRTAADTNHCRRMSTELLIQIQNFEGSAMFILCATNCPWEIDPAFLRRFQRRIYVPLPDMAAREKLILNNIDNDLSCNESWKLFIDKTKGLTGSDIKNIAQAAMMFPLGEIQSASYWMETNDGKMVPCCKNNIQAIKCTLDSLPNWKVWCRSIQMKDLWSALEKIDKTITEEDLERYIKFRNEHALK